MWSDYYPVPGPFTAGRYQEVRVERCDTEDGDTVTVATRIFDLITTKGGEHRVYVPTERWHEVARHAVKSAN